MAEKLSFVVIILLIFFFFCVQDYHGIKSCPFLLESVKEIFHSLVFSRQTFSFCSLRAFQWLRTSIYSYLKSKQFLSVMFCSHSSLFSHNYCIVY
jgi:hypothetical protein